MKNRLGFVLILFSAIVFSLWWVTKDYSEKLKEGAVAPHFTLQNRFGENKSLKDYHGKVVLLNFWATWCGPCVAEMKSLEELYQHFKDSPFEILAINVDEQGWTVIDDFLKRHPITFPILWDKNFSVSEKYGNYRLPESFLIDPAGEIVDKIPGAQNWTDPVILGRIGNLLPQK